MSTTTQNPVHAEDPCLSSDPSISRSETFDILSNDRRQHVIEYLLQKDEDGAVPLGVVVTHVAARENDVSVAEVTAAERKRVYTALRQCHLPKLDDYGVVDYNQLRSEVGISDGVDDVRQYLNYDPQTDVPWDRCYLGLSAITALAIGLSLGGIGPFGAVPTEFLTIVTVSLFLVTSGAHTYQNEYVCLFGRDG